MLFYVTRTSSHDDSKPCSEAIAEEKKESNYRQRWQIEINSLQELVDFIELHDFPVVIEINFWKDNRNTIEIYDDYRE